MFCSTLDRPNAAATGVLSNPTIATSVRPSAVVAMKAPSAAESDTQTIASTSGCRGEQVERRRLRLLHIVGHADPRGRGGRRQEVRSPSTWHRATPSGGRRPCRHRPASPGRRSGAYRRPANAGWPPRTRRTVDVDPEMLWTAEVVGFPGAPEGHERNPVLGEPPGRRNPSRRSASLSVARATASVRSPQRESRGQHAGLRQGLRGVDPRELRPLHGAVDLRAVRGRHRTPSERPHPAIRARDRRRYRGRDASACTAVVRRDDLHRNRPQPADAGASQHPLFAIREFAGRRSTPSTCRSTMAASTSCSASSARCSSLIG